ncbi:hypothetical protein WMF11_36560 [Sorangium sp. So ce295]|uniref:hypothetical protein n=1 Tax=Sorangium sp. So ce295 TaxID=3133295 RepID=UPI003F63FFA7
MRRLVNTSISLFFGLMMLQTLGAGCTALVEVGDDSDDGGGQAAGPDDDAHGTGSGGVGGNSSTGSSSSVGNGGNSSTGGASSVGAGGSASTGSGSGPTAGAIALLRSEFPEPSNESGSSSSGGGPGPGTSPNDLFIIFGVPVSSCADPTSFNGCDNWALGIAIPPALQVPGILDLSAPEVLYSNYTVSRSDRGDDGCWWGEGSLRSGTMEIVSIDAAEVVVRLSGTDTHDIDANGEYTAARCP